jgi:hypothetical protein
MMRSNTNSKTDESIDHYDMFLQGEHIEKAIKVFFRKLNPISNSSLLTEHQDGTMKGDQQVQ